ncbi:hypothetical protein ATN92_16570 [Companilactobacillus bobalius]|nr:hypothetical protein ATN92_16570 [Companilactobacillus bobalius]
MVCYSTEIARIVHGRFQYLGKSSWVEHPCFALFFLTGNTFIQIDPKIRSTLRILTYKNGDEIKF